MSKSNETTPNVPTLRFRKYTSKWTTANLSNFLYVSSKRNKDGTYTKEDVLSVSGELGIVNQITFLGRSYAGESVLPYHIVEEGDIVYTKSPLALYPYGIIKTNRHKAGIVSTLYAVYKTNENANNRFIEHYFSLKSRINNYLKPIVRIGAKHDMKIGNNEVLENTVTFPYINEQYEIADFLDLIDKRISVQNKIISKYETLIKGITDRLCEECKTQYRFKDLYIKAGEGGTPTTDNDSYYQDGTIPFIKIEDLNSKYIVTNKDYISQLGLSKSSAWLIPSNSVIYSNGATIGCVSINNYPIATKQGILGIIPSKIVLTEYLYYYLQTTYFRKQIKRITVRGTMDCAYLKDINSIFCFIPAIAKQQTVIHILSSIDKKLLVERKILLKLKEQKNYLLSKMFI